MEEELYQSGEQQGRADAPSASESGQAGSTVTPSNLPYSDVPPVGSQPSYGQGMNVPPVGSQPPYMQNSDVPPVGSQPPYGQGMNVPPAGNQPPYGQNPYMQPVGQPYGQNPYMPQAKPPKGDGVGFGIASLCLGVASIFLFSCCVNYITAILAVIFGVLQIVRNRQRGPAVAGIVTAAVSVILGTILWAGVIMHMEGNSFDEIYDGIYDEFYHYYEDQYPLNDYMDEL